METELGLHDRRYRRAGGVSWCSDHLVITWGGVCEHRYRKPKGPNTAPSCGNSYHDPRLLVTFDPATRAWAELGTSGQVRDVTRCHQMMMSRS